MNGFAQKLVCFVAAASLAVGGLVGCGPAEPKTAQEVLTRNEALKDRDNYHADTNMTIEVGVFGSNMAVETTISTDGAGNNAYSTSTASALGIKTQSESYTVKEGDEVVTYMHNLDGDQPWVKTTSAAGVDMDKLVTDELLKDATFEKSGDGYALSIPGDKLMNALGGLGGTDSVEHFMNVESLKDAIKSSTAKLTFDKDCRLTGVEYGMEFSTSGSESGSEDTASGLGIDVSMKIDMKITISGYGSVDASKVALPDDVKANAVENADLTSDITSLLNGDEGSENADAAASNTAENTEAADSDVQAAA